MIPPFIIDPFCSMLLGAQDVALDPLSDWGMNPPSRVPRFSGVPYRFIVSADHFLASLLAPTLSSWFLRVLLFLRWESLLLLGANLICWAGIIFFV